MENVRHLAQKQRNPIAAQHGFHPVAPAVHGAGGNADVPPMIALIPHKVENLLRHPGHFLIGVGGAVELNPLGGSRIRLRIGGKQLLLQRAQIRRTELVRRQALKLHAAPVVPTQRRQTKGSLPHGVEHALAPGGQHIAAQADGDALALAQHLCQHQLFLGREVGEAGKVNPLIPQIVLPCQHLCQPGQAIPRVLRPVGGQALIGGQNQTQLLQALSLVPGGALPCRQQQLGGNAAALALVRGGNQLGEEGNLFSRLGIDFQRRSGSLHGNVHQQQPPALVQHRPGTAAVFLKHPLGKAGKGQHLAAGGNSVPAHGAEQALHGVGVLLRHDQQPFPLGLHGLLHNGACNLVLVTTQQQL